MASEQEVIEILKEIIDPHSNISVYDMRLISDIKVTSESISLTFRPTSAHCPLGVHLAMNIKRRLGQLNDIKKVDVKVVGHMHEDMINRTLSEA